MKKAIILFVILIAGIAIYLKVNKWLGPAIVLTGISSKTIVSMKDTLIINLKFEDRDGDIGDSIKSNSEVFVEDTAYKVIQDLPIITHGHDHSFGPVIGRLKVLVNILPLLDTCIERTTRLKIYITDRHSHKSNVVESDTIHLSRNEF